MKNEESLKYVQAKMAARPKGISVNIFHRDFGGTVTAFVSGGERQKKNRKQRKPLLPAA